MGETSDLICVIGGGKSKKSRPGFQTKRGGGGSGKQWIIHSEHVIERYIPYTVKFLFPVQSLRAVLTQDFRIFCSFINLYLEIIWIWLSRTNKHLILIELFLSFCFSYTCYWFVKSASNFLTWTEDQLVALKLCLL